MLQINEIPDIPMRVGLRWGPKMCISNRFPRVADTANLKAHLEEQWFRLQTPEPPLLNTAATANQRAYWACNLWLT